MLLTGIFILFWLQYQFTIMKLQDLEESSFLSKSAQVISIKDTRLITQKILIHIKMGYQTIRGHTGLHFFQTKVAIHIQLHNISHN